MNENARQMIHKKETEWINGVAKLFGKVKVKPISQFIEFIATAHLGQKVIERHKRSEFLCTQARTWARWFCNVGRKF